MITAIRPFMVANKPVKIDWIILSNTLKTWIIDQSHKRNLQVIINPQDLHQKMYNYPGSKLH